MTRGGGPPTVADMTSLPVCASDRDVTSGLSPAMLELSTHGAAAAFRRLSPGPQAGQQMTDMACFLQHTSGFNQIV